MTTREQAVEALIDVITDCVQGEHNDSPHCRCREAIAAYAAEAIALLKTRAR